MRGDRLNLGQRIVLVVAAGGILAVLGRYLVSLGHGGGVASIPALRAPGLFPGARVGLQVPIAFRAGMGLPDWARLLIWVGVIAAWVLISLVLLARPTSLADPSTQLPRDDRDS